jgi:hypothetical protein
MVVKDVVLSDHLELRKIHDQKSSKAINHTIVVVVDD